MVHFSACAARIAMIYSALHSLCSVAVSHRVLQMTCLLNYAACAARIAVIYSAPHSLLTQSAWVIVCGDRT